MVEWERAVLRESIAKRGRERERERERGGGDRQTDTDTVTDFKEGERERGKEINKWCREPTRKSGNTKYATVTWSRLTQLIHWVKIWGERKGKILRLPTISP